MKMTVTERVARYRLWLVAPCAAALLLAALAGACGDPLSIETPRIKRVVNHDSLVAVDSALRTARGDTIYATIERREGVVFAVTGRKPERPIWHNLELYGGYYIAVLAARSEQPYEAIALRLDGIRDTGTYYINGIYSSAKGDIDSAAPRFAARYEGQIDGLQRQFDTGILRDSSARIRVLRINVDSNYILGTFQFKAYCPNIDSTINVTNGAFRLTLKPE